MKYIENAKRSLVKTVSYRILIIISTWIVVFFLTGDYEITFGVTLITSIANTLLYYLHERFWNTIHWGKKKK